MIDSDDGNSHSEGLDRAERIRLVADGLLRRWGNGESVSIDAALTAHSDLLPELTDKLRALRLMTETESLPDETLSLPADRSAAATVHNEANSDADHGASGLHIRCPHCRYQVELLAESEFDHITCSTCGSIFSLVGSTSPTQHAEAIKIVGHFELISRLGIGSFGAVWKAYDVELDRAVAVKIPRRGQLDPLGEAQFLREARVSAQLRHPHIVSVHEVGRDGDLLYIVSDLIRGVTLKDWLSAKRLTPLQAADLSAKVADALHHAHVKGVIHRDLKPSNILMDEEGEPRLTDFGLAKRDVGEVTMTAEGQILGTPAYMSPEQAAGQAHHVDRRTDVYALGAVLFELLTGELPFRGSIQMQIHQKLQDDAPSPRSLNRLLPYDLSVICTKCLQREPTRRYASAQELAADLRRFLRGEPIVARPMPRLERLFRWAKRKPAAATAFASIALLAVAGPLAAWRLEILRRALESENAKYKSAIADRDRRIEAAGKDLSTIEEDRRSLRNRLAVYEEGGDPEFFWPRGRGSGPYFDLLSLVVQDLDKSAVALPTEPLPVDDDLEGFAYLHLAWGIAYEELHAEEKSLSHLKAARAALRQLVEHSPHEARYLRGLSDCDRRLAGKLDAERDEALEAYRERQSLERRLASGSDDLRRHADWLDAELRLALAEGDADSAEALLHVKNISQGVLRRLPLEPKSLYELVCHLCRSEPVLTDGSSDAP